MPPERRPAADRQRRRRLRSPLARAVVPVLGGIAFFVVLGLAMWGMAALVADNSGDAEEILVPTYQDLGSTERFARAIAADGPLVLPDLAGRGRSMVLDHTGDDPDLGWALYLAYPGDRGPGCTIELQRGTRQFTDCEGRTLAVDDLALPPAGVQPIVSDDGLLTLDLVANATSATTTP